MSKKTIKKIVLRQTQHNPEQSRRACLERSRRACPEQSRRIVCLGGGSAMPKAVLQDLKKYPVKISVICATLDSGGSSGRLRKDYNIISPGDIRRSFIELSDTTPEMKNLFNYRFQTGKLKGHNFANLFIAALKLSTNSYKKTFKELSRVLNTSHQILPATTTNSTLYAELENEKIIKGETNIDIPKHDGSLKIKKVFLRPKADACPRALEAIDGADLIVIGPGDLYSSLIQILLVDGISKSIKKSKAKKVYLCNLMTKFGETNNFTILDFTKEIEKYLETEIDYVIYNNFFPEKNIIKKHQKIYPELLNLVKIDKGLSKTKFIGKNLLIKNSIEHSSKKVSRAIVNLL